MKGYHHIFRFKCRFFRTLCYASLGYLSSAAWATPITIRVNVPQVDLIVGTDPSHTDELYAKANIDNSGYQKSGVVSTDWGHTIVPNWSFTSTIDPRGRSNYDVPISLQLWDDDSCPPFSCNDEQIDINPTAGNRTLNLTYNMGTRTSSLSSPRTGNPPGDQATFYFTITSDPFRYAYDVSQFVTVLGPGLWEYEYKLTNLSESTFNVDNWIIPSIGTFDIALQPGETFDTGPFRSNRAPRFVNSMLAYDDLGGTSRIRQVLAPLPEPASLALVAVGLAGMGVVRRRGPC